VRPTPSKRRFSPVMKKPERLFAKLSTARRPKLNNFVGACPLLAQSGHPKGAHPMSLSGAKRTWPIALQMSAFDPKRTSGLVVRVQIYWRGAAVSSMDARCSSNITKLSSNRFKRPSTSHTTCRAPRTSNRSPEQSRNLGQCPEAGPSMRRIRGPVFSPVHLFSHKAHRFAPRHPP
jgi:hypothetical protein